jgi:hypothetical protein
MRDGNREHAPDAARRQHVEIASKCAHRPAIASRQRGGGVPMSFTPLPSRSARL